MATYQPDRFARARPTGLPSGRDPFRLLYVGRIAVNKGVLDAVRVMRILEDRHPGRYVLAMCGSGPDEDRLAAAVERTGLGGVVTLEGECPADRLHAAYAGCHAVLVPTRSDFEEGQPKVAFEAVLNYRPLVMSAACPALNDVGVATIEARVDDVEDYVSAIERLSQDRDLYARAVDGTRAVRGTFLEPRNGYHAALQKALERVALRERS
jgi:glycosyltransferase involved in cell wall biosynthesis